MSNRLHEVAMAQRDARWAVFWASVDTILQQRPVRLEADAGSTPSVCGQWYHGVQSVPIYKITSFATRFSTFEHVLAPAAPGPHTFSATEHRAAYIEDAIELYKVGDSYVVKDGNQRVMQARRRGQLFLPAHVTEYTFDHTPLDGRAQIHELLLLEEHFAFFAATRLRPDQRIACSTLGNCDLLLHQIAAYRTGDDPAALAAAATRWYTMVYAPLLQVIQRARLGVCFSTHTETDLYLWATGRSKAQPMHAKAALRALALLRRELRRTARSFNEHTA